MREGVQKYKRAAYRSWQLSLLWVGDSNVCGSNDNT